MSNRLPYVDIFAARTNHRRKSDPGNFEYTYKAEITNITPLTLNENLYQIQICDPAMRNRFTFKPGQFVMVELPGIGEAPFSISSSPFSRSGIELCIRKIGSFTNFLSRVERGTKVGLSGPFGTHFPVEKMLGQNILLIAGGLGIVPLRSPLLTILENRKFYGQVDIMYGAKSPAELLFTYQHEEWRRFDVNLAITVDMADSSWDGHVGLITEILQQRLGSGQSLADNFYAIVCGPPVMFRFVCTMLTEVGMPMEKMFVSLERRMHCGRGKCCRCNIGSTYTCLDGPVFDYWSVMNLKEAI